MLTIREAWVRVMEAFQDSTEWDDGLGVAVMGRLKLSRLEEPCRMLVHGICIAIYELYDAQEISDETFQEMDKSFEKAWFGHCKRNNKTDTIRGYLFPHTKTGAEMRVEFCRAQIAEIDHAEETKAKENNQTLEKGQ